MVYNLKTREIYVSRDVIFYESKFPYASQEGNDSGADFSNTFTFVSWQTEDKVVHDHDKRQNEDHNHSEQRGEQSSMGANSEMISEGHQSQSREEGEEQQNDESNSGMLNEEDHSRNEGKSNLTAGIE